MDNHYLHNIIINTHNYTRCTRHKLILTFLYRVEYGSNIGASLLVRIKKSCLFLTNGYVVSALNEYFYFSFTYCALYLAFILTSCSLHFIRMK